jgi:hypothetical protein
MEAGKAAQNPDLTAANNEEKTVVFEQGTPCTYEAGNHFSVNIPSQIEIGTPSSNLIPISATPIVCGMLLRINHTTTQT